MSPRFAQPRALLALLRYRQAELAAATAFVATAAVYSLGAGRSYDYDSGVTVGYFVATPSLLDPFRRERVFNNHPLLSFADHVVYSLGGHSEAALRAVPILAGAATIALLAWFCTRRWGLLAGAAAAAVVASNPLFGGLSREVRGYSLLTFATLASTIAFVSLHARTSRAREGSYVAAIALGIGTHLYGLLIVPIHASATLARRELSIRWLFRWSLGVLVGLLAWVAIADKLLDQSIAGSWQPSFDLDLEKSLLGTYPHLIDGTVLLIVAAVVASWPPRREVVASVLVAVAVVLGIWLVIQPVYLYPRFFVWLVPGIGVLAAVAVARWPVLALIAAACVASSINNQSPTWVRDPAPSRTAARILREASADGMQPCVLGFMGESLTAYPLPHFRVVPSPSQLPGCTVAVSLPGLGGIAQGFGPIPQARALLPYHTTLHALSDLEVDSAVPLSALTKSSRGN